MACLSVTYLKATFEENYCSALVQWLMELGVEQERASLQSQIMSKDNFCFQATASTSTGPERKRQTDRDNAWERKTEREKEKGWERTFSKSSAHVQFNIYQHVETRIYSSTNSYNLLPLFSALPVLGIITLTCELHSAPYLTQCQRSSPPPRQANSLW